MHDPRSDHVKYLKETLAFVSPEAEDGNPVS